MREVINYKPGIFTRSCCSLALFAGEFIPPLLSRPGVICFTSLTGEESDSSCSVFASFIAHIHIWWAVFICILSRAGQQKEKGGVFLILVHAAKL